MYTQVLVYSIAHSLSAQKQYKHKCKPGFIFQFNRCNRIFRMLEDVKITNVRSICRTFRCYCKETYENLQKMFNNVQFGWVVKKYEMH